MLYGLLAYHSNRLGYLTYPWDYYDAKETVCSSCGRSVNSHQLQYWPPHFSLEEGKRYPDCLDVVVPFQDKCGMILSEKALCTFQMADIRGFDYEPVRVSNAPDMPNYYYIYVRGSISLDYKSMHYRKKNVCPECGQYTWSRQKIGESALDYASWDGSDICKLAEYPNKFVCTEKVIDVIKKNHLKGFARTSEQDIFRTLKAEKL